MNRDEIKAVLENILLVAGDMVKVDRVRDIFPEEVSRKELSDAFKELVEDYKGRNIKIISVAGGYSFATDKKFSGFIERYTQEDKKNKLTRSTLEVLSIVSYKQPVTRVEIDTVRGVDSSHIVRSLVEKRFIKPAGKKDVPGKPMMYATTDAFLKHFGLNSIRDLKDYKSFGFETPAEN